jgi:hypothetical protein
MNFKYNEDFDSEFSKRFRGPNLDEEKKRVQVKSLDDLLNLTQRNLDLEKEVIFQRNLRENDRFMYEGNINDLRDQNYRLETKIQELKTNKIVLEAKLNIAEKSSASAGGAKHFDDSKKILENQNLKLMEEIQNLKLALLEKEEALSRVNYENELNKANLAHAEKRVSYLNERVNNLSF